MKLYIDTSNSEKITIRFDSDKVVEDARGEKAQKLLATINEGLKKRGKEISDIESIEVKEGPGSFTGLRVGISVANALGWALGVPVNDKDVRKEGPVTPNY